MSDQIKHECGLAMVRLLKPLQYYHDKYGTALYGLNTLQILLQKMRNRGQDGAGLATIKLDMPPGNRYVSRKRTASKRYLEDLFVKVYKHFGKLKPKQLADTEWLKENIPYTGELLIGHLRYGTHGINTIETCHPFLRKNNYITRNLVMAGNFNLTNVNEMFQTLIDVGQHPKESSDTVTVMEKIGHYLDLEVERLFNWFKPEGFDNQKITQLIAENMDITRLLQRSVRSFDGGYVMGGMIGHGDAFVVRDPSGIRPAFYYQDDEIVVVASEKPAIQTALRVKHTTIKEIKRGHALIIKKDGTVSEDLIINQNERKACSFERIYFSRGTDRDIYLERKKLGELMAKRVLEVVDYDLKNTVFSFIPNTAETSFYGMVEGINQWLNEHKLQRIKDLGNDMDEEALKEIVMMKPRVEKLAVKDAKMRTFIANDDSRKQMVSHVYDVTYGIVNNEVDTLVVIDDSIVRGTTLRDSILQNLSMLKPKKIIVLSSAPQIRYPDCYGIDMSRMKSFVAFRALVELLKQDFKDNLLEEVYQKCLAQQSKPKTEMVNYVQFLYENYTQEQISAKIAEMITPQGFKPEVQIMYQTIEGLHEACPNHTGDWYFSGNYPTPGGVAVVNQAFINFMENKDTRAYA